MPITCQATIEATNTRGTFHITWYNIEKNTADHFDQSAIEITPDEANKLWQKLPHQLTIGKKLFHFLDGDARHLQRALNEAAREGELLQLYLRACQQVADLPFEYFKSGGKWNETNQIILFYSGLVIY